MYTCVHTFSSVLSFGSISLCLYVENSKPTLWHPLPIQHHPVFAFSTFVTPGFNSKKFDSQYPWISFALSRSIKPVSGHSHCSSWLWVCPPPHPTLALTLQHPCGKLFSPPLDSAPNPLIPLGYGSPTWDPCGFSCPLCLPRQGTPPLWQYHPHPAGTPSPHDRCRAPSSAGLPTAEQNLPP